MKVVLFSALFLCGLSLGSPVIRINIDASPVTLEPPLVTDTIAAWVLYHIADRLVEEHRPGQLQGNLAERWTIEPNHLRYHFFIRAGRKFDDGVEVTNQSIADSLLEGKKQENKSRIGFYFKNIRSVKTVGKNELVIELHRPSANFLQIVADSSFSIFRRCQQKLCFSGEFALNSLTPQGVSLTRKKDGQQFQLESLTFPDALARYKKGELDLLRTYSLSDLEVARQLTTNRMVVPDERTYFIAFNVKSKRFRDKKAREQILSAINQQELATFLEAAGTTRAPSLLSSSLLASGMVIEPNIPTSVAGEASPFKLILIDSHRLSPLATLLFKGQKAQVHDLPKATFLKTMMDGDYDALIIGYGVTVRDWDYLAILFHSKSSHNFIKLSDPQIDELLDSGREELNPAARLKKYTEILRRNAQETWYVPITHIPLLILASPGIDYGGSGEKIVTTPFLYLDGISRKK